MEEKKTVFSYLANIFMIFGVTVLIISVLTVLCGEEAKEVSTIFALGGKGIPVVTILQFFLTSVLTATINMILFSDGLIRKVPLWCRTVFMLLAEVIMVVIFVAAFGWFPMDMWEPWVMFFASFLVCFGVSVGVTVLKEKMENRKMEAALERIRKAGYGYQDGNSN